VTSRNPLRVARAGLAYHTRSVLRRIARLRGRDSQGHDDGVLSGAIQAAQRLVRAGVDPDRAVEQVSAALRATLGDPQHHRSIVRHLEADMPRMLYEYHRLNVRFERHLRKRWGKALDLFCAIVVGSTELGDQEYRDACWEDLDENQRAVLEAVSGIHARACRTSWEVYELLQAGFPKGAQARARTLHELAVTALILSENVDEPGYADIGARFLAFDAITSSTDANEYQAHAARLNEDPLSVEMLTAIEAARQDALRRFPDMKGTYGWARHLPGVRQGTFKELERVAGLDHLRPYYSWASQEVHAGPKGVRLNTVTGPDGPVKLAGRTNFDLADPAQTALIALQQVNGAMITSPGVSSISGVLGAQALQVLVSQACDEFVRVQLEMQEEFGLS
jgi:Family of unknown function (DUF5677)